jgi:beta-lactamase superfamily II metal-dependent hydrolase
LKSGGHKTQKHRFLKNQFKLFPSLALVSLFLCGCSSGQNSAEKPYPLSEEPQVGASIFGKTIQKNDVEVYFFDVNNLTNIDGTDSQHMNVEGTQAVGSSDCYLIKSGDVEVMVDCGIQTYYYNNSKKIEEVIKSVVLPKLASVISSDGILDYLIVTHGDFDHISGLSNLSENDYGLFDAFQNQEVISNTSLEENKDDIRTVKLSHIRNIIDFESDLVHYLEIENAITSSENVFFPGLGGETPTPLDVYFSKRDKLIKTGQEREKLLGTAKKIQHIPASRFFIDEKFDYDQKLLSFCDYFKSQYYLTENSQIKLDDQGKPQLWKYANNIFFFGPNEISHMDKDAGSDVYVKKTIKYQSPYAGVDVSSVGTLENEEGRFFFKIPISDKTELRILYNQFYDFFYQHSISSQDRNNISVMLEAVDGSGKFLSFGDAGGNAESGVCNYYENSEILKNATVVKASHHGSTYNDENSNRLFQLIKPEIVVIPAVARVQNSSGSKSFTYLNKDFFENISKGNDRLKYIFCVNVGSDHAQKNNPIAYPFYGDVHIGLNSSGGSVGFSNSAGIDTYMDITKKSIKASVRSNGKIISMEKTTWFAETGWSLAQEG